MLHKQRTQPSVAEEILKYSKKWRYISRIKGLRLHQYPLTWESYNNNNNNNNSYFK